MGDLFDIPILTLFYWLGYHTAFYAVLALIILNTIAFESWAYKIERKLDLE